mmetsp:Transcript_80797/g.261988  ORF Transcript_80797/g.261988 Transcript_80797/m.261988 type:complete len:264 (-) Transcript_80797:983-1774(-)
MRVQCRYVCLQAQPRTHFEGRLSLIAHPQDQHLTMLQPHQGAVLCCGSDLNNLIARARPLGQNIKRHVVNCTSSAAEDLKKPPRRARATEQGRQIQGETLRGDLDEFCTTRIGSEDAGATGEARDEQRKRLARKCRARARQVPQAGHPCEAPRGRNLLNAHSHSQHPQGTCCSNSVASDYVFRTAIIQIGEAEVTDRPQVRPRFQGLQTVGAVVAPLRGNLKHMRVARAGAHEDHVSGPAHQCSGRRGDPQPFEQKRWPGPSS